MPRSKEWGPVRRFPNEWPPLNPKPLDPTEYPFIPERSVEAANLVGNIPPEKLQLVGIKVYASAATTITANTDTDLTFNTTVFNEGFATPAATFTTVAVPRSGLWIITSFVEWESDNDGARNNRIQINGSTIARDVRQGTLSAASTVTAVRRLTAGDTVGIEVRQSSATGPNLDVQGGEENNNLSVVFLGTV